MKNKIIPYNPKLKEYAKELRKNSTLSEVLLWQQIKNKALGVQFHRQVPMLEYIVDFYCPAANLVIELDGSQHFEARHLVRDQKRDADLMNAGLQVLRFDNRQVLLEMQAVLEVINEVVGRRKV